MITYRYHDALTPPAPFINLTLIHPVTGEQVVNVPAQLDTGADRTVLPTRYAQRLGLPQVDTIEARGLGGVTHFLAAFAVRLAVHDREPVLAKVIADDIEPWVLLSRDILNGLRLTLDGPRSTLEVP